MATPYDDKTPLDERRFEVLVCLRCNFPFAEPRTTLFCAACAAIIEKSLSVIGTAAS